MSEATGAEVAPWQLHFEVLVVGAGQNPGTVQPGDAMEVLGDVQNAFDARAVAFLTPGGAIVGRAKLRNGATHQGVLFALLNPEAHGLPAGLELHAQAIAASSRSWQHSQAGFRARVTVVCPGGGGEGAQGTVLAFLLQNGLQEVW
ncbi:hypothetical protein B484DRAFT_401610 [Ochromonadaceae sp. CCMP2298]|nr:hypothetical protein B484DRAFT_401610 [Ochromonadaceae sp. CCMP2298]